MANIERDWVREVRLLFPWMPDELVKVYADSWAQTGDPAIAMARVRDSATYDRHFPGIKRDDGTLRMSEQEYHATKDAYSQTLREFGLNPKTFESKYTDLITGDVSAPEFAARLDAAWTGIASRTQDIREFYAANYGIALSQEAIFASAIDPQVGAEILNRRISVSQVGGVAAEFGFDRTRGRAEWLVKAGVDESTARQLYSTARQQLPTLNTLAQRWFDADPEVDLDEFERVAVFADPEQTRRFTNLMAAEQSSFSERTGTVRRDDEDGLSGLRRY